MSGICAIYNRAGQPVDRALVERMLGTIAHRGPDGRAVWVDGAVGFGHALLATTAQPQRAPQPLQSPDGQLAITFDGRIDNRVELLAALANANIDVGDGTDADVMMGAYSLWGEMFLAGVLGDFALAIWDARRRQLVCATDILGLRPCYYYQDDEVFICGSELPQLFAAGLPRPPINEAVVAEHLIGRVRTQEETLYRGVFRVPAGYFVIVGPHTFAKRQYFDLDPSRDITYGGDDEYAEHYRSLFIEAVRCRVPTGAPVAAYLSGGLDSSSITGVVEHLRRRGEIPGTTIETFSIVAPGMPGDETEYIEDVARQGNLAFNPLTIQTPSRQAFVDQVRQFRDVPEAPNVIAAAPLGRLARQRGCRVMLTGMGGDDWLSASGMHGPELLAKLRVADFLQHLRLQYGATPANIVQGFVRNGVWPLLPQVVRTAVRSVRGRSALPSYITASFARATSLVDRVNSVPRDFARANRTRDELYHGYASCGLSYCHALDDRHHAWLGLDARHPFHDRRLIEFALAIPEEQRWRGTETKFVLRQAIGDLLPSSVRSRVTKGGYSHAILDSIEACGGERCFESLDSVQRGWVDKSVVVGLYRKTRAARAAGDQFGTRHAFRLWMIFAVDLWLRNAVNEVYGEP